ncbi:MAG: hypothetical protein E7644_07790 [Ruminococcaceae bacterium]|nr:hypothetical protein [Oscillospiraceae bacterium]
MSKQNQNIEQENGEYAVRRSVKGNIVAAVICLLLAVVVWAVVMNAEDSVEVELQLPQPADGYTYTLSVDGIEIKGKMMNVKRVDAIEIAVPEEFRVAGTHTLTLEHLVLPEGVAPAAAVEITLTVTEKPR